MQHEGAEVHSCTAGAARGTWVGIQPRPGCSGLHGERVCISLSNEALFSLPQPRDRPRSCRWWTSRAWRRVPPTGGRGCAWTDTTSSTTPKWCLWRRLKVKEEDIRRNGCVLSVQLCVCVCVCVCVSRCWRIPKPAPSLLSRRQNILHLARVPHVVHINAQYF